MNPQSTLFKLILSLAVLLAHNPVKAGIDGQLAAKIKAQQGVSIKDEVKEIRKEIGGQANRIKLLDNQTIKSLGLSSFDKNKTDDGELFIFRHIAIGYATEATIGATGAVNKAYNTDLPSTLRNARLLIKVGNDTKLFLPLSELSNYGVAQDTHQDYFQTTGYNFWGSGKDISIEIELPDGIVIPDTEEHYIEVRIKGAVIS